MKITLRPIISLLAIASLIIYTGCGGGSDPAPSVEDQQLEKLTATWSVSSVTLDGVDKTADYKTPNFQLSISGTPGVPPFSYSAGPAAANRPVNSPWPLSGTWTFGTTPESKIVRGPDNIELSYAISGTDGKTLQVSFTFAGTGYAPAGREANVKGAWVFTFTKP